MKADAPPNPDRKQIDTLVRVLFKHAAKGTYVSLRSFPDDDSAKPFEINCIPVDNRARVVEAAFRQAQRAANEKRKIVFCPPIATFNNKKRAGEADVADGLVLTTECDKKPQAARTTLEALLGPTTLIVASGGEWINPETGELEPKLHLHWRLKKPARGSELALLEEARKLVIALADSDPSHWIGHPIRWPGSWHRKGEPRLCRIVTVDPEREIDLHEALAVLRKAAPAKPDQVRGTINDSPWGQLNSAALGNLAAWVPEIFPTARKYHGDGFRVKSKNLGRKLQEDISFTRDGIKDFGVHDLGDPRAGKRTPIDIVLEWKFDVSAEDIAWREHTVEFQKAVDWLREQLGLPQDAAQEHPQENIEPVDLWGQFEPPALPRKLLPKVIEDYAFTTGATMGADPAGLWQR
jgi:hypothetical protein